MIPAVIGVSLFALALVALVVVGALSGGTVEINHVYWH